MRFKHLEGRKAQPDGPALIEYIDERGTAQELAFLTTDLATLLERYFLLVRNNNVITSLEWREAGNVEVYRPHKSSAQTLVDFMADDEPA